METVKLRILTAKSIIDFEKYKGWTVQKLLDNKRHAFLEYVYFNYEKISFTEDVLSQLKFTERINKPGIDKELYGEIKNRRFLLSRYNSSISIEKLNKIITAKKLSGQDLSYFTSLKRELIEQKKNMRMPDLRFSKSSLQCKNHGH